MVITPSNPVHRQRLQRLIEYSRRRLEPFRRHREEALRQFVGTHYSDFGAELDVPVNMIELAVQVYSRILAARSPRVLVTTRHNQLVGLAAKYQLAINETIKKLEFATAIKQLVQRAIFSMGIAKIGLKSNGVIEVGGQLRSIAATFIKPVSIDDWVHDMTVGDLREASILGNRYRIGLDEARENESFDKKARSQLTALDDGPYNEQGDQRAAALGTGAHTLSDGFPMVELWDLYLPAQRMLITLPAERDALSAVAAGPPLRILDWDGPERGPFHILAYTWVEDNSMPLPPRSIWTDLHQAVNSAFRKVVRQVARQKEITAIPDTVSNEDGDRVLNASDGELIPWTGPGKPEVLRFGGPDQANVAFTMLARQFFTYFAGNLDAIGGLDTQADTLGQEQILQQGAGQRIEDYADITQRFSQGLVEDIGWYMADDPLLVQGSTREIPGTGLQIPVQISADEIRGLWNRFNFAVEPYSMRHLGPTQRLFALTNLVQTVIIPLGQQLAAQGIQFDMAEYIRLYGEYTNTGDELARLVRYARPGANDTGPVSTRPSKPPNTTRTEVRKSVQAPSASAREQSLVNILAGNGQQQAGNGAPVAA